MTLGMIWEDEVDWEDEDEEDWGVEEEDCVEEDDEEEDDNISFYYYIPFVFCLCFFVTWTKKECVKEYYLLKYIMI